MLATSAAGCANQPAASSGGTGTESGTASETGSTGGEDVNMEGATLTYWYPMWANEAEIVQSVGDMEVYQKIEEKTGVHIEFISPPTADTQQAFVTLVASSNMPDIIQHEYFVDYPGGPDKAIEDGVYLRLNELMDQYAPNYLEAISDPSVYKQAVTDEGNLWCFSMIDTVVQEAYTGPMYRKDWLEKVNMEVPTTIDEVHDVLTAFKEKLGVQAPLLFPQNGYDGSSYMLISAYGVSHTYYNDGGTVKFGPIEDGYREYLETMKQWYSEGLIDQEFPTKSDQTAEITTDKAGMWVGNFWSPETWKSQSVSSDVFEVVAGPYPTLSGDGKVAFKETNYAVQQNNTAITTACKTPEIAAKWLDYKYSEEGYLLCNFGTEGEGYTMIDGEPEYTDFFTENKNPRGYEYFNAQYYYLMGKGPYLRLWSREMFSYTEDAWDMLYTWEESSTGEAMIPNALTMTPEEGEAFNVISSDVATYVAQQTVAFITGQQELNDENWNKFIDTLKSQGIEEAISYKQAAFDRYQER